MGDVDWGVALASGIGAGAGAVAAEAKSDQDNEEWLQREAALDKMHRDAQRDNERFLMGLKPPETRKLNVAGKDGTPALQQQEWVPPAEGEAAGHFTNVGDETPDINFERLDETAKHNRETEQLTGDKIVAQSDAAAARLDAAAARAAAAAGRKQGTETQPKTYTFDGPGGKPIQRVGHFEGGTFIPAVDENGRPVQAEKYKPTSLEEKADAAAKGQRDAVGPSYPKDPYSDTRKPVSDRGMFSKTSDVAPVFVDPSAAGSDEVPRGTLPQIRPQKAPTSTPANARGVAPASTKAAPYQEGQTIYDKQGRRYIVRNGQPVPA